LNLKVICRVEETHCELEERTSNFKLQQPFFFQPLKLKQTKKKKEEEGGGRRELRDHLFLLLSSLFFFLLFCFLVIDDGVTSKGDYVFLENILLERTKFCTF
jgi:hypothetical protein